MRYFYITPKVLLVLVFIMTLAAPGNINSEEKDNEIIKLGKWNEANLEKVIKEKPDATDKQINFLSQQFLGTPYVANTLTGNVDTTEVFTIDLEGMDCFTYIDYVEALRLSQTMEEFSPNLKEVRYLNGQVSFENRNHFFSDWPVRNNKKVRDITKDIGGNKAIKAEKNLNLKKDGSNFLPGIPVVNRSFYYIPSSHINDEVLSKLHTGDYVGIYTDIEGLDVSHTGIIIRKGDRVYLRHASSRKKNRKVVDEDFRKYIQNTPGVVIFRPL